MTPGAESSSTRERLLEAAIGLFASKGYAATSVADIQLACGLAAGSGAMYKHFSSKQELLNEAARRYLETISQVRERLDIESPNNAAGALRQSALAIWNGINGNAQVLRVMFREPEAFPEVADELWSRILADVYQRIASELRAVVEDGKLQVADPDATAAALVASLAYYPVVRLLIGHTPGGIEEDRYREAWVQQALSVLGQDATKR